MKPSITNLATVFEATGWAFAAGPEHMSQVTASVDCMQVMEYPLNEIAQTLLCFPNTQLLHTAEPSWQEWHARWQEGEHVLELRMVPFFRDVWLQTALAGRCPKSHVLTLWAHLLSRHSGIWLREQGEDDSYLHTPVSFLERQTL